jgi:hypothetical protein
MDTRIFLEILRMEPGGEELVDSSWYPRAEAIDLLRRVLGKLIYEENQANPPVEKPITRGSPGYTGRSNIDPNEGASMKDEVDCLLMARSSQRSG